MKMHYRLPLSWARHCVIILDPNYFLQTQIAIHEGNISRVLIKGHAFPAIIAQDPLTTPTTESKKIAHPETLTRDK